MRVQTGSGLFGTFAAAMIALVLAYGLFSGWVLLQYGAKATDFDWQAQRLGQQWYVSHVAPGGQADGTLRTGDLLLSINGEPVTDAPSLGLVLRSIAGSSLYGLRISRAGAESEVWLRATVRNQAGLFRERFPLMVASALFFIAGVVMLLRWDSAPARIGFVASMASSLRMGAWAMLPITGYFQPLEMHAYYIFWLPVGLALPASLHALLRFSDRDEPGPMWWSTLGVLYVLWGTGVFTVLSTGAVPAPVPEGVAYVYWDHVGYQAASLLFTIGLPVLLVVTLASCGIRMRQLLHLHPDGDTHRRLVWLLSAGTLFALPMTLCEAAKWLGLEYNTASSWLSSLTAICAAYALGTESVSTPAMVFRGLAGGMLPERQFQRLDQKYFPACASSEHVLRTAVARVAELEPGGDWRPIVSSALESAFHPVRFAISEKALPGELIEVGDKSSGESYTRREVRLVDQLEDAVLALLKKKPTAAEGGAAGAAQTINLLRECPKCGVCYDSAVVRCAADGQIPALTLPVERVIDGKYRLDRLIGRGGMGSVYGARDLRLDRRVALKIMLSELFGHDAALRRFEREARVAAKISHPNIIQIFDFGAIGTMGAYQVMELAEGRTWRSEIVQSGPVGAECLRPWIEQLLDGIQAAHEAGVIHRDLKPDNLLLVDREAAPPLIKILDFGLAKMNLLDLSREEKLSLGVTTIGTVGYVPPEQLNGGVADQRSDIYAIGRILIETLTGSLPAPGGAARPAGVDQHLAEVLARCTAAAPADRYSCVADLRAELLPALASSMSLQEASATS